MFLLVRSLVPPGMERADPVFVLCQILGMPRVRLEDGKVEGSIPARLSVQPPIAAGRQDEPLIRVQTIAHQHPLQGTETAQLYRTISYCQCAFSSYVDPVLCVFK